MRRRTWSALLVLTALAGISAVLGPGGSEPPPEPRRPPAALEPRGVVPRLSPDPLPGGDSAPRFQTYPGDDVVGPIPLAPDTLTVYPAPSVEP